MAFRKISPDEKLEDLRAQRAKMRAEFDERLKKVERQISATERQLKQEAEKNRVHRAIIIGTSLEQHAEFDEIFAKAMWEALDKSVKKRADREFLGLQTDPSTPADDSNSSSFDATDAASEAFVDHMKAAAAE